MGGAEAGIRGRHFLEWLLRICPALGATTPHSVQSYKTAL